MESMIIVRYNLVEKLCSKVLATLPECYKAGFVKGLSITKIWKDDSQSSFLQELKIVT